MANPKTTAPVVDNLAELELANASLAERVGELETELAQRNTTIASRDHSIASLNAQIESVGRELVGACDRAASAEDNNRRLYEQARIAQDEVVRLRRENGDLCRDVEQLSARRVPSAPIALDIAALLDLHRIVGSDSDRYLATARRLGDALVAQLDAADPG